MKKMMICIVLLALILQPGLDAIQTLAAQGNILDEAVRPKSQATSKTSDAASAVNYALNFDGADDYIEVPNSASLNPAQITVGVWVKSANKTWNATGSLVSKRDVFIVHPESGSRNIKFFIFSGGWVSANFNAPYDFDITKWHHYAGTFDGKAIRIYVDGKLVGETLRSGNINTGDTGPLFIGKDDGTARYFSGMIDDIRIWDRALDQAEIKASVYPPGVYSENLKASWQFNQGSGVALTDSSGNNNTGTLKNGPAWKSISGLTGRVTDPEGAGISGVKIFAARPKQFLPLIFTKSGGTTTSYAPVSSPTNPLEVIPVVTDADGYYSVPYLSQGRYIVTAEQDSVVFTPASRAALLPEAPVADFHVEIIPAKIPETTQVLSDETKQSLQSVSADGSVITFTQATPQLQQLSPGDILVSEEVSGTTDGMIRKVMDIKNTESGLVVDTEAAALEDAIEDGATYDTGDLAPSDVISATMIQGVEMLSPTSPDSLGFRLGVKDAVIYDADNNLATIGDQVRASGSIEFVLDFQFYLEFKAFKLNSLLLANKETLNDSIEVYSGADLAGFQWQKILGTVKFKKIRFMIGAVPIYIHPTMDILLGVDGNVSIGMSTSLGHKFTMRTGISYTSSSGWRPIAEASSKLVFTPPHPLLSAGIYAYIGAKFNFYLYGVAGPYGQFTPYTEFTVAPLEDPW